MPYFYVIHFALRTDQKYSSVTDAALLANFNANIQDAERFGKLADFIKELGLHLTWIANAKNSAR